MQTSVVNSAVGKVIQRGEHIFLMFGMGMVLTLPLLLLMRKGRGQGGGGVAH